jgi:hypothetical protein
MFDLLFGPIFAVLGALLLAGGAVLAIAGGVVAGPRLVGAVRQRAYDRETSVERVRWVLRLDPSAARDPDATRRLVAGLHPGVRRGTEGLGRGWPELALRIRWTGGHARWEIEAPSQLARAVTTAVSAAYPDAELEETTPEPPDPAALLMSVRGMPPESSRAAPVADLGVRLVELMARLPKGARAVWSLDVRPIEPRAREAGDSGPGIGEMVFDGLFGRPSRSGPKPSALAQARQEDAPAFTATPSLRAAGPREASVRAWLFDAMAISGALRSAGWRLKAALGGRSGSMTLTPRDLAELWGLPAATSEGRAVELIRSRRVAPPVLDEAAEGAGPHARMRPIGRDGERAVLVPESVFGRHVAILGRTGSGKSTELVALAADDLRSGRGFTFLDPHGDAVAKLVDLVPPEQIKRVHLLELAERDRPRAFNPLELDGAEPELVAGQFVDTIRDLFLPPNAHRQIGYLRNGLMTLLTHPVGRREPWTIESLHTLFVNPAWRAEILRDLDDPTLLEFWEHIWPRQTKGNDASADAILSKLGAFLTYPSVRAIVSTPRSTIQPKRIMDEGRVLLVDLSRVGRDHAGFFGSLLIDRIYVAALGRQGMPVAKRTPHTLYVDEVQRFDTSSLRGIPGEGRKFAVGLVVATQDFRGLGVELQSALRANIATLILAQPSTDDAALFADEMAPLSRRDLINLPRFRMAIRTEIEGDARVLTANVLAEPASLGSAAAVRRSSDERDGRPGRGKAPA